jgi:hypothetical protein
MGRLLASVAVLALALVAAPTAGAKGIPWLLEVEQPSARVGETIDVKTVVTPRRGGAQKGFDGPRIGVYLVPGALAGHFFLRANTPVLELGTLQSDFSYRGRRSFKVPSVEPGRYALGARVGDRFLIGDDVLVVRRGSLGSMEPFAALVGLALGFAALARPRRSPRRRSRRR